METNENKRLADQIIKAINKEAELLDVTPEELLKHKINKFEKQHNIKQTK